MSKAGSRVQGVVSSRVSIQALLQGQRHVVSRRRTQIEPNAPVRALVHSVFRRVIVRFHCTGPAAHSQKSGPAKLCKHCLVWPPGRSVREAYALSITLTSSVHAMSQVSHV